MYVADLPEAERDPCESPLQATGGGGGGGGGTSLGAVDGPAPAPAPSFQAILACRVAPDPGAGGSVRTGPSG